MVPPSIAISLLVMMAQMTSSLDCNDIGLQTTRVDDDFNAGELELALTRAEHVLSCSNTTVEERVLVHLKLSEIFDRKGLHNNSRPAPQALSKIEAAAELADSADLELQAAINLAMARYYYRAETPNSDYPTARNFARLALELFEELEDLQGQADTIHLTGLFHFQRRELEEAQVYFERSLVLENLSGTPRPGMLGDYERHMGFVHQLSGDLTEAINKFERSFVIRRENGLADQAMFAAIALGRALLADNRARDAQIPLIFASNTAEKLGSPEGRARAGLLLGQMYEQLGDREAAISAFQKTLTAAREISRTSTIEASAAALNRLLEDQS